MTGIQEGPGIGAPPALACLVPHILPKGRLGCRVRHFQLGLTFLISSYTNFITIKYRGVSLHLGRHWNLELGL